MDLRGSDGRRVRLDAPVNRLFGPRRHAAQLVDRLAKAACARRRSETDDHLVGCPADVTDRRRQLFRTPGEQDRMLLSHIT